MTHFQQQKSHGKTHILSWIYANKKSLIQFSINQKKNVLIPCRTFEVMVILMYLVALFRGLAGFPAVRSEPFLSALTGLGRLYLSTYFGCPK